MTLEKLIYRSRAKEMVNNMQEPEVLEFYDLLVRLKPSEVKEFTEHCNLFLNK